MLLNLIYIIDISSNLKPGLSSEAQKLHKNESKNISEHVVICL